MAVTNSEAVDQLYNAQQKAKTKELTGMLSPANQASSAPAAASTTQTPSAMTTQNRVNEINNMYDAQRQSRMADLQSAYDISRSEMQAQADKIAPQYQQQANANAVDWERQRRNFMEGANMNGLNTGAGAQAELHMMGQQQRGMNALRNAQANAEAESGRQLANLTAQYQANIQKAAADNDYNKAAALLDEYGKGFDRDLKNAQILAEFGDFSGYEGLYGPDYAKRMSDFWAQQNPDVAYVTGRITQDQRDNIKAGRPIDDGLDENGVRVAAPSSGGGGGNGSDYNWYYDHFYYTPASEYRAAAAPAAPAVPAATPSVNGAVRSSYEARRW